MKGAFLTQLILSDDGDGAHMTLVSPLVYRSERLKRTIAVDAGFITDFASVPRALWAVWPPHGGYDRAAIIHDYLYVVGGVDRGDADGVLNEAMDVCGVGRFTRWVIYAAVRSGGWKPWGRYREA